MRWFPLESNPSVMNRYIASLGVDISMVSFHDVFGLDPDLLSLLPQPVLAMLLVFPVSDTTDQEAKTQLAAHQAVSNAMLADPAVMFMKQTIGNACGTIGILHALLNSDPTATRPAFKPDTFISAFAQAVPPLSPSERAAYIEQSKDLHAAQEVAASEGQTATGAPDDEVDLHFVCFCAATAADGSRVLLEFDGRQDAPIVRGGGGDASVSLDVLCAEAIQARMAMMPESLRFTITAMCAAPASEE